MKTIWIDSGLNILKAGKYLNNREIKVISALKVKLKTNEFRVTNNTTISDFYSY